MSLIGAIDDATGKIVYAVFRPTEDLAGYLMMLRGIAMRYGIPEIIYHDRHTILRSPKPATIEDELAGAEPQSQFQRVYTKKGLHMHPNNLFRYSKKAINPKAFGTFSLSNYGT